MRSACARIVSTGRFIATASRRGGQNFAPYSPDTPGLSPAIWTRGELWRLVTYGFVGTGSIGAALVLQIACVYWFGFELCVWLGEKRARVLVLAAIVGSSVLAAAAQFAWDELGGHTSATPFSMMQGQRVTLAATLAGFAARNREGTVSRLRLLYGLTVPSRWLVPLQLGWAVVEFGRTQDLGGLVGIVVATALGWRIAMSPRREDAS